MDDSGSINHAVAVCPTCGAGHRAGLATCADCGVPLVPIDAERRPADNEVEPGTIEIFERAPSVDESLTATTDPNADEPMDLFFEEHPSRVVPARLDGYNATDAADRLDTSGIGGRILIDRYSGDTASLADVCVPSDRVDDARELLRVER